MTERKPTCVACKGAGGGANYTAGTGIVIENNEISADTSVLATNTDLEDYQPKLTAGSGISIVENVISASDGEWKVFDGKTKPDGTQGSYINYSGLIDEYDSTNKVMTLKYDILVYVCIMTANQKNLIYLPKGTNVYGMTIGADIIDSFYVGVGSVQFSANALFNQTNDYNYIYGHEYVVRVYDGSAGTVLLQSYDESYLKFIKTTDPYQEPVFGQGIICIKYKE